MPKRKLKRSQTSSCSPQVFEGTDFCHRSSSSEIVLSDLPDEILRLVCEFLDPQSVVAISDLNIRRLKNQISDLKSADFSVCNTIRSQDLQSYFNTERVKQLQKINFNNLFFVQPSALTACIGECKNITKLYIFNCGISFSHLTVILDSCTHLEELYWSIKNDTVACVKQQKIKVTESIKKLYLQADLEGVAFLISSKLLDMCPNLKEVTVNFSPCYVTSLPANSASRYFTMQIRRKEQPTPPISILLQCEAERFPIRMLHFVKCVSALKGADFFDMEGVNLPFYFTYHTTFLQFFDENEQLAELPTLPDESVKSMVMIMNRNLEIQNHLDKIKKMTGNALTHLSLYKLMHTGEDDIDSPYICDVLCDLVANSCNITVLDLSQLHTTFEFPFLSLCNLKKLKVFNVSTCLFVLPKETKTTVADSSLPVNSFADFVIKCVKVERFSIYDCKADCKSPPMNDTLTTISKWPELKYLTVQNVKALRECQFLLAIADSCPKFKSLEFIGVGEPKVCLFMSGIKHILMKSKELKFLRINHSGFYPMDPLLWNNIESAQKLQGLCLSTQLSTAIVNKTVLEAIRKLPHLHLFHLLAQKCCENLSQSVKRVMTIKGVKVPDVKTTLNAYYESYEECSCRHFPIE